MKIQKLDEYIKDNFRSSNDFADAQGVAPQQVTQWKRKDFIVIDHHLYSVRRKLNVR